MVQYCLAVIDERKIIRLDRNHFLIDRFCVDSLAFWLIRQCIELHQALTRAEHRDHLRQHAGEIHEWALQLADKRGHGAQVAKGHSPLLDPDRTPHERHKSRAVTKKAHAGVREERHVFPAFLERESVR